MAFDPGGGKAAKPNPRQKKVYRPSSGRGKVSKNGRKPSQSVHTQDLLAAIYSAAGGGGGGGGVSYSPSSLDIPSAPAPPTYGFTPMTPTQIDIAKALAPYGTMRAGTLKQVDSATRQLQALYQAARQQDALNAQGDAAVAGSAVNMARQSAKARDVQEAQNFKGVSAAAKAQGLDPRSLEAVASDHSQLSSADAATNAAAMDWAKQQQLLARQQAVADKGDTAASDTAARALLTQSSNDAFNALNVNEANTRTELEAQNAQLKAEAARLNQQMAMQAQQANYDAQMQAWKMNADAAAQEAQFNAQQQATAAEFAAQQSSSGAGSMEDRLNFLGSVNEVLGGVGDEAYVHPYRSAVTNKLQGWGGGGSQMEALLSSIFTNEDITSAGQAKRALPMAAAAYQKATKNDPNKWLKSNRKMVNRLIDKYYNTDENRLSKTGVSALRKSYGF